MRGWGMMYDINLLHNFVVSWLISRYRRVCWLRKIYIFLYRVLSFCFCCCFCFSKIEEETKWAGKYVVQKKNTVWGGKRRQFESNYAWFFYFAKKKRKKKYFRWRLRCNTSGKKAPSFGLWGLVTNFLNKTNCFSAKRGSRLMWSILSETHYHFWNCSLLYFTSQYGTQIQKFHFFWYLQTIWFDFFLETTYEILPIQNTQHTVF